MSCFAPLVHKVFFEVLCFAKLHDDITFGVQNTSHYAQPNLLFSLLFCQWECGFSIIHVLHSFRIITHVVPSVVMCFSTTSTLFVYVSHDV